MARFIDTHAHLDFPDFAEDVPGTVERAAAAGIDRIITIGCDFESSRRAVALAEKYPGVFAAVGWHPGHVLEAPDDVRPEFLSMARHPKVVAIGECGVDYYRLPSGESKGTAADDERYRLRQEVLFRQQLEVAAELGLNVIVHQREAPTVRSPGLSLPGDAAPGMRPGFQSALEIFRPYADRVRAVFHCFVGTPVEVVELSRLGSLVSFTGILTFKNGAQVRESLSAAAPSGFMLETDCPFLAPVPYRGQRCEPAYVREIAVQAAAVCGWSLGKLSDTTNATASEFFPKLV